MVLLMRIRRLRGCMIADSLSNSLGIAAIQQYRYTVTMKATIEIPDELYRRVKARSALLGRSVREVTTELYQRWLGERPATEAHATASWIDDWVSLGAEHTMELADETSARQHLDDDRNRLEAER